MAITHETQQQQLRSRVTSESFLSLHADRLPKRHLQQLWPSRPTSWSHRSSVKPHRGYRYVGIISTQETKDRPIFVGDESHRPLLSCSVNNGSSSSGGGGRGKDQLACVVSVLLCTCGLRRNRTGQPCPSVYKHKYTCCFLFCAAVPT